MAKVIIQKLSLLVCILVFSFSINSVFGQCPLNNNSHCPAMGVPDITITAEDPDPGCLNGSNPDQMDDGCVNVKIDLTSYFNNGAECDDPMIFLPVLQGCGNSTANIDFFDRESCICLGSSELGYMIEVPFMDPIVQLTICRPGDGSINFGPGLVISCPEACEIQSITAGDANCEPASLTYSQDIVITYAGGGGQILVSAAGNAYFFDMTSSPQTVSLDGLPIDGNAVDVTACFTGAPGCDLTEINLFTAPSLLTVEAGDDVTICVDPVLLTATPTGGTMPYNFNWTPGDLQMQAISVNPINSTLYTVVVTDALGCTASDNVTVDTDSGDDSDDDGYPDFCDVCPNGDDSMDADGDGVPDDCDPCPLDINDDSDGDGVCDSDDICMGGDDADDPDGDGVPNFCDICPFDAMDDSDGDGVCDSDDICPGGDDNVDDDMDGIPNDCDLCTDSEFPVFVCPEDLTFDLQNPNRCRKLVNFTITATDDCTDPLIINQVDNTGYTSGDRFPIGVTTLIFETTDEVGNTSTCSFDVIVNEFEPEQLGCKNINLSVDQSCEGYVTIDMILTGDPVGCPGNFEVTLTDHYGNPVPQPITSDYLWQTLDYHVSNPFINFACWGTVTVEDKFAPIIDCDDITLSCAEMLVYNGPTIIFDNCSDYRIEIIDQGATPITDCDSDDIKVLHRAYRAIDEFGNVSNECIENITIERVNIGEVVFPGDSLVLTGTALSCSGDYPKDEDGHPSPSHTGEPMLDGIGLWSNNPIACNLVVYYEDNEIPGSSCVEKIMRMWYVREWFCDREYVQPWAQQIEIADTEGPSLTPPIDITMFTNPGTCSATVFIPALTVKDTCNEPVEVDLFFENGFRNDFKGEAIPLPVGESTVSFIAYDQCWNSSEEEMQVTIKDNIQPTMICELESVVSLSTGETVRVYAESYDAGTSDNCELDYFEVRRMFDVCVVPDNLEFGPYVEFCCADIGTDVMVQLRAYDISGNYNECMVMVEVQDKIPPIIVAPPNITVSCTFDFVMTDLDGVFGQVVNGAENVGIINIDDPAANFEGLPQDGYVEDNCFFPVVAEMDTSNINNCGEGYIVRRFSIGQGSAIQTVEQRIDIINPQPFNGDDESDLDWPEDYTTENVCDSSALAPALLPPGYAEPLITEDECDLVAPTFSDEFYDIVPGEAACFKVLRTWTVIDWCQRNSDGTFKTWTHLQTLKVSNTNGPSITSTCEDILVESLDGNCGDIEVALLATATDDCTPGDEMFWRYDIDIDSDGHYEMSGNTNDASGFYETGKHTIRWIAEDRCGNESEPCFRTFELKNLKAPTAKCLDSLTTRLVPIAIDAAEVTLDAEFFNGGSDHVCEYEVNVSFSSDENDTQKTFTCADVGFNEIELWATDAVNGNQSFCIITVEVLDAEDAGVCGLGGDGDLVAEISGQIFSEFGESLESVDVHLAGAETDDIKTGSDGYYAFPDMPKVGNYEVIPNKSDDPLNGVSTLDLVLMQRHILGLEPLSSVYKLLAADVNVSYSITASDMVELRKVILGVSAAMPDGKSWRFVDADHQFISLSAPWTEAIPATYPILALSQDMVVDFIGYKVGDVSGNAESNLNSEENVEVRSGRGFSLLLDNKVLEKDQIYEIEFKAGEANEIFGMQWDLDISSIEVLDVYSHSMKIGFEHLNMVNDHLRVSWSNAEGLSTEVEDVLFSMVIRANKNGILLDEISIIEDRIQSESYLGPDFNIEPVTLRSEIDASPDFSLYQNEPNPWNGETIIRFELPRSGLIQFKVFDYNGKQVFNTSEYLHAGDHSISLSKLNLNQSGIYFYELGFEGFVERKKMILIK